MPIFYVCDYTANRNLKTGILMYISIHPFSVADIVVRVESEFISFSKAYPSSSQNSIKFIRVIIMPTRLPKRVFMDKTQGISLADRGDGAEKVL